jgi:hypothetical protein
MILASEEDIARPLNLSLKVIWELGNKFQKNPV